MALPTETTLIDSNRIKLTPQSDVNYILQWGATDPQQLATQKVVIVLDMSNTGFTVTLPPLSQEQSQNAEFYFTLVGLSGNTVNIQAADGDIIARSPSPISLENGAGKSTALFFWLIENNWNYSAING